MASWAASPAGPAPAPRLLVFTDRGVLPSERSTNELVHVLTRAAEGAPAGALGVVLRERDLPGREQVELARAAIAALRPRGTRVLVSERVDVALASDADGVHLPAPPRGLPAQEVRALCRDRIVGVSTHSIAEVEAAATAGADLVTFGPVYATPSKLPFGDPVGVQALMDASALARERGVALLALGGVDEPRVPACRDAGAHGVACIRAVLGAPDPTAIVRRLTSRLL